MVRYEVGGLVRSKAGHDKDNLFIILKESEEYVYLVDGKIRTLDKPKCKKKKHIQIIHEKDETLSKKLIHGERIMDEEVKHFIRCCKREDQIFRR